MLVVLGALVALAAVTFQCGPMPSRASKVTGKTYCGGIMDPDLGDRLGHTDDEGERFYAVIAFRNQTPRHVTGFEAGIASCTGWYCFAHATKRMLFAMCGWVGVTEISSWSP
jgi:hypothetical protein